MPLIASRANAAASGFGGLRTFVPPLVITGGSLTSDATYYYRTFTGNGTL